MLKGIQSRSHSYSTWCRQADTLLDGAGEDKCGTFTSHCIYTSYCLEKKLFSTASVAPELVKMYIHKHLFLSCTSTLSPHPQEKITTPLSTLQ